MSDKGGANITGHPLNVQSCRDADRCRGEGAIHSNVYFLAVDRLRLHHLGQDSRGGQAAAQSDLHLRTEIDTSCVAEKSAGQISKTPSMSSSSILTSGRGLVVRDPRPRPEAATYR